MRDFLLSIPNAREFMGTSDVEDIEVEEVRVIISGGLFWCVRQHRLAALGMQ